MYPIDKNQPRPACGFLHFMALAIVTVRFMPIDWPGLKSRWLRADDPVRAALAGDILPRDLPVLYRPFRHIRKSPDP